MIGNILVKSFNTSRITWEILSINTVRLGRIGEQVDRLGLY